MLDTPTGTPATQDKTSERGLVRSVNWLAGALVVALWIFFALWAQNYRATDYAYIEVILDRQRSAISEHVDGVFRLSEAFLAGANTLISEHPERDPRMDQGFENYVRAFQRVTNQSMLVRMAGDDGTLYIVPAGDARGKANAADRDFFLAAMRNAPGEIFISAPFLGRVVNKWAVAVATRLSKPSHGVSVVFVAIELSVFDNAFENARLPEGGAISLIRGDGILLARSGTSPVELGIDMSRAPTFTEGLAHADHGVIFTPASLTDNVPKLVAYGRVSNYPVVIAVSESISAIERVARRNIYTVAIALFVVTVVTLLARWRVLLLLEKLADNRRMLGVLASQDHLTGTMNRRRFLEACDEELTRARRYRESSAFVIIDIDHFKHINDGYGHPAGDQVLKSFATTCRQCLREVDHFGRLGGEEFGILLPSTSLEGAEQLAERIRLHVASIEIAWNGTPLHITASFGITEIAEADVSFDTVYVRADKALYQAKEKGRNRTCSAV